MLTTLSSMHPHINVRPEHSAIRAIDRGVHRLTMPMKPSTSSRQILACPRARSATGPSVFMMSQVAPSKA